MTSGTGKGWHLPRATAAVLTVALSVSCLWTSRLAAQEDPPRLVSGPEISTMIRSTIVAIDQANATGNYTVLRDLSALSLYYNRSATDLADIFKPLRERGDPLSDVILQDPMMSEEPKLTNDGLLQLKGWFPRKQENLTFEMTFRFEFGAWRILSVSLDIRPMQTDPAPGGPPENAGSTPAPKSKKSSTVTKSN